MGVPDIKEFLMNLKYIVNIDSGSANIKGNEEIATFLQNKFDAIGYNTQLSHIGKSKRPYLKAENRPGEIYDFLLVGHIDTVYPDGTVRERPFTPDGDRIIGPGTVDMKAGTLLIYYVCKEMAEKHPEISIGVSINSDEEIGSPDSAEYIVSMGENAKCAFVFEGARKNGQFVSERRGIAKYRINVIGKASHSGTAPQLGSSAIVEIANWVLKLDKGKNYAKGTTVNTGLIKGGTALNVVADSASALTEVRYTDNNEFKRIERLMLRMSEKPYVSGTRTEIEKLSNYKPLLVNEKTENIIRQMKEMENDCGQPIAFVKAGGISDANRLAHLGIAIIDGCGPSGGFPHNENEFLSVPTVMERFQLMCYLISHIKS